MSSVLKRIPSILLAAAMLFPVGGLTPTAKAEIAGGPAPAGEPTANVVYHEKFASGKGAATQSGGASLAPVTGKAFDGNEDGAALYVSNRKDNWDAADFKFADIGLTNGKTYSVTVSVYVDADASVPEGAQAYLQTVNSYAFLAGADFAPGQAATLTKEFTVDTSKDTALRVQSNPEGASVPFYIGDVLITEKASSGGSGEEPPRDPALPFDTVTFEDQTADGFVGRAGTETLTVTNEANHTDGGSYSLKVEGRTSTWHSPTLRVEKYVDKGSEYKISAWVKLISPDSSQLQLSTQVGQGSSANYVNLSPKTVGTSDGWVQFEGTYRYNSVGGEYLTIYVESSNNATASFYIDDIGFENTGSGAVAIQKDLVPVKTAYQDDFLIGNAISAEDLEGVRLELLKMHHNVATAGNAMKPDALQPTKGSFTFASADALVDKVLAEGLQMHGHVLVWHQQSPAWMNTDTTTGVPLSRDEALDNMRTHIRTVMEHFGNKVISWDVVNEAMNDNPSNPSDWQASLRQSPWYNAIGPDYVEQAFLAAREVLDDHPDWNIKLYYNDYNEDNQNKAQAIASMVQEINDRYAQEHPGKLLIDGIGMQAHYNINTNPDNVKLSLEKFISLGVEISVTELDIQAGSNYQLTEKQANAQGYLYAQLMKLYHEHADKIARVTFWGMDDNTSWRASSNPLLFDKNLQAKPAYYGVIDPDTFMAEHIPETSEANQAAAAYGTPVIDGTIDAVWSQATALPINRYQMAWQGATGTVKALWDDNNLYVLIQVSDAQQDKTSANAWEQDSVEIFLDRNNAKTSFYQDDDGQYRINYENETSFSPPSLAEGFVSAAQATGTNYVVEVKIPIGEVSPANDKKLGFDVQINDAKDGARQSVAAWNDTTGTGYMDTSVYGVLTLAGKSSGSVGGGTVGGNTPTTGSVDSKDGVVTIKPEVKNEGARSTGLLSGDLLDKALGLSIPNANGTKPIVVDLPKQTGVDTYEVQVPADRLKGKDSFELTLRTELGTLVVPSDMLQSGGDSAKQAAIRISPADLEKADTATRERIGNHPVVELSLILDGKTVAWSNPAAPVTVSVPYTPTAAELRHPDHIVVWYIDGEGKVTAVPNGRYDAASGAIVFQTTHFSTYAVAYAMKSFEDIAKAPWAKSAIEAMASRDVIRGTSATTFAPASAITRTDFIALLVRALELQDSSFAESAASQDQSSRFTREEMMTLTTLALEAAGKKLEAGGSLDAYSDTASLSASTKISVSALVQAGIINGKNGKLAPSDTLTRAEAAVILYRVWKLQ